MVSQIKQQFIKDFFAELNKQTNYCILRNYERLPEHVGDDIDMLVEQKDADVVENVILPIVKKLGWDYHIKFRKEGFTPIICMYTTNRTVDTCQLDVYTQLLWRGCHYIDEEAVLASRYDFNGYSAAGHGTDLAITIAKELLGSGSIRKKYNDKISAFAKDDKDGFYAAMNPVYGKLTDEVYRMCVESDIDGINKLASKFKSAVKKQSGSTYLSRSWKMAGERIHNWFHPEGKMIAFVGPDGSGKTTLIGKLDGYMERLFPHNSRIFHRRYEIFPELKTGFGLSSMKGKIAGGKTENNTTNANEAKKAKRSLISKIAGWGVVIYYTIEYMVGNCLAAKLIRRRTLILYDRYYYDHFVQPATRHLIWPARRFLLSLVRKPDLIIHLIATGEHIYKRKKDLSQQEIDNQNFYMSRILECCDNVVDLNMEQMDADQVAAEVFRIAVKKLYNIDLKENA